MSYVVYPPEFVKVMIFLLFQSQAVGSNYSGSECHVSAVLVTADENSYHQITTYQQSHILCLLWLGKY